LQGPIVSFGFDEAFSEAVFHSEHKVMGRKLRPFSYWHKVQLEYLQSRILIGGPTLWDYWIASKVCSLSYPENFRFKKNYSYFFKIGWNLFYSWRGLARQAVAFSRYLEDYASPPKTWQGRGSAKKKLAEAHFKFWEKTGDVEHLRESEKWRLAAEDTGAKPREVDDSIEQISIFMKYSGRPAVEAWNMPLGELVWYNVCFLKMDGSDAAIWTPADQARFDQHVEKRNQTIADIAKEMQLENPILPDGIALVAAEVKYWRDTVVKQDKLAAMDKIRGR
jgi:hypothetical protein